MTNKRADVIIIGGGITGVGIARDLALRGIDVILLERGDLSTGATGRSHGLLHSGGRYVVKDPSSAKECAKENKILKKIARHVIEDTGGLFVATAEDSDDYVDKFVKGCKETGVLCKELTIKEALELEPILSGGNIKSVFYVNDGAIDPFKLTILNALDAIDSGGVIHTYKEVIGFLKRNGEIIGVKVRDNLNSKIEEYYGDIIVNATGAWGHKLGKLIGIDIPVKPSKGSLIIFSRRITRMVINRLRLPGDGDIFVPSYATVILGTTSVDVNDPDDVTPSVEELKILFEEGRKLIPNLKEMRMIRSFAGPRPLVNVGRGREAPRTFTILDHGVRDNIEGLFSIFGGKLTTYRLMAERISDLIAKKLGVSDLSKTDKYPLPGYYDIRDIKKMLRRVKIFSILKDKIIKRWGSLTKKVLFNERTKILCMCESVTVNEIQYSIREIGAKTIGDVMRRTKASMGPCQGQNCTYKITGILYDEIKDYKRIFYDDLSSHIRKRWANIRLLLHGAMASQEALTQMIFNYVGNLDEVMKDTEG